MNLPLHFGVLGVILIGLPIVCESLTPFPLMFNVVPSSAISSRSRSIATSAMNLSVKSEEYNIDQVELSSGVTMKVQWLQPSTKANSPPPLIFLHGSFHGGWCWMERFFAYFSNLGYPVAALNWRGTGGTFAGDGVTKVKMEEHVKDLKAFLDEFVTPKLLTTTQQSQPQQKPILISHSFGGLTIMKYLEEYPEKLSDLGGAVIMCSVPPSGNGRMTMRFLRRSLRASWKITKGLAMKKVIQDPDLCRELFFGGLEDDHGVSDADVVRYMGYFGRDSEATIDLMDLAKKLPSAQIDDDGKALFLSSPAMKVPPFLVVGAKEDFIVDQEGVNETARYFGVSSPLMVESPHDVMLGKKYKNAADVIHRWVQAEVLKS
jgi:pimeloyl-ACP methyl ester carboxylesterase